MKKALFLDRDGVVNVDREYVHRIEDFEFIPAIFDLCRSFQDLGYEIIIITNQAGIARGYYGERDFALLTEWMLSRFLDRGIQIAAVYHCPHHPDFTGVCRCRKPHPGMILDAADELGISLEGSVLIGNSMSDIAAGKAAGVGLSMLTEDVGKIVRLLGMGGTTRD